MTWKKVQREFMLLLEGLQGTTSLFSWPIMDLQVGGLQNCLDINVSVARDVLNFLSNLVILHRAGLGSNMDDICGKDWGYGGGDHGDAGRFHQFVSP